MDHILNLVYHTLDSFSLQHVSISICSKNDFVTYIQPHVRNVALQFYTTNSYVLTIVPAQP